MGRGRSEHHRRLRPDRCQPAPPGRRPPPVVSVGVGERTRDSIAFLLGLPLTRSQILWGKAVGRFAGVGAAAVAAALDLAGLGLADHGPFAVAPFVGVLLSTLALCGAVVAVGVLLSTLARRTVTAATAVFAYVGVTLFWSQIVSSVHAAVTGVTVDPYDAPASGPLFLALRLTPDGAYNVLTNWLLGVGNSPEQFHVVQTKLTPGVSVNAFVVKAAFGGAGPWYLHPALSAVTLVAWTAVLLVLARRVFGTGDAL